jgi:tetratricopeptide (TPR) repeat protein
MRLSTPVLAALGLLAAHAGTVPAFSAPDDPPAPPAQSQQDEQAEAPRKGPPTLDDLFARLSAAKDEDEAKGVAGIIERRWMRSGSDTADLLLTRALEALQSDDQPLAIELLDRVIALQPGWAEAWNKRATVFFMMGDYTRSMADLREVLSLEPRHFSALAGMGAIFSATGDDKHAYEAYKKALGINPWLSEVKEAVEKMAPEYEGRDI